MLSNCSGPLKLMACLFVLHTSGCESDPDESASGGGDAQGGAGAASSGAGAGKTSGNGGSGGDDSTGGTGGVGGSSGPGGQGTGGGAVACDYQAVSDIVVIEAEDLALPDSWQAESTENGYTGSGYRVWTGPSQNNNPGQGLVAIDIYFPNPGRYHMQWRNRIGMGSNTTEHNDSWVRFADTGDFYGMKVQGGVESRRYPKPKCEDGAAMDAIEADPMVSSAQCPNGSSSDGWFKVYSSGASDWSYSTRTSDNDAHDIFIEIDQPGVHTMEFSARADFHLIDRIVIFEESVDTAVALDTEAIATPCR